MATLTTPEGDLGYTDQGSGPLVLLVPGMGDTLATWRDLEGPLVAAGHRVVATDLRGHGSSATTFDRFGDDATGGDLIALLTALDAGPAVVIGNSMGGSAAVWVAAQRPDLVAGLVLVSPFLRGGGRVAQALTRTVTRLAFRGPWGAAAWTRYYAGPLSRGRQAPWLGDHVAGLRAALGRPGGLRALRELARQLDHAVVDAVADLVTAPTAVVVGALDPDYRDPAAELAAMGRRLGATTVLVPDVAHYAQHQAPEAVLAAATGLTAGLRRSGDRWAAPGA